MRVYTVAYKSLSTMTYEESPLSVQPLMPPVLNPVPQSSELATTDQYMACIVSS